MSVKALLDTGAEISAMTKALFDSLVEIKAITRVIPLRKFSLVGAFTDKSQTAANRA